MPPRLPQWKRTLYLELRNRGMLKIDAARCVGINRRTGYDIEEDVRRHYRVTMGVRRGKLDYARVLKSGAFGERYPPGRVTEIANRYYTRKVGAVLDRKLELAKARERVLADAREREPDVLQPPPANPMGDAGAFLGLGGHEIPVEVLEREWDQAHWSERVGLAQDRRKVRDRAHRGDST